MGTQYTQQNRLKNVQICNTITHSMMHDAVVVYIAEEVYIRPS